MILWTIQREEVYQIVLNSGVYHADEEKILFPELKPYYDWLVSRMEEKIGVSPAGVHYPVWAWYNWYGKRKKPDLRDERWHNGFKGDRFVRLELEIPEERAVLSDFDAWSIILLNGLITDSEQECDALENEISKLAGEEQQQRIHENWERVFDITPLKNLWTTRGSSIQATFWELRKEDIRKITYFTSTSKMQKIE